jgi:hypothetical protein
MGSKCKPYNFYRLLWVLRNAVWNCKAWVEVILRSQAGICKYDTAETRMPYLSRVFQNIQSLILNYGKALIWQVSVSQASRRQFLDSKKILRSLQLSKNWIPSWSSRQPSEAFGRSSVFEKILNSSADMSVKTGWRQQATIWTLGNTVWTLFNVWEDSE